MGFLGGIIQSLLGGIAGAANPRPPSLSPIQQTTLNNLLGPNSQLQNLANQPAGIDPIQQMLLYGQNAQSLTGANNQVTHSLTSRGLGRSGLLGAGLIQNANQSQANQGQINLGLQQQGIQRQQSAIQSLIQLLNVNNTKGQSGLGAFMAGLAPVAAYSIQNQLNGNYANANGTGGYSTTTPPGNAATDSIQQALSIGLPG
jgi:hypothetical protein